MLTQSRDADLFVGCLYHQIMHQLAADRSALDPSAAEHFHSPLYSHKFTTIVSSAHTSTWRSDDSCKSS